MRHNNKKSNSSFFFYSLTNIDLSNECAWPLLLSVIYYFIRKLAAILACKYTLSLQSCFLRLGSMALSRTSERCTKLGKNRFDEKFLAKKHRKSKRGAMQFATSSLIFFPMRRKLHSFCFVAEVVKADVEIFSKSKKEASRRNSNEGRKRPSNEEVKNCAFQP